MTSLPPICWRSFVFLLQRSDDLDDHYRGDGIDGRLRFSRAQNLWLASLHEASAVVDGGRDGRGDREAPRRALDAALTALRARATRDQALLARIEEETG